MTRSDVARVPASPALDFYELRREGIGHIEKTGSRQWTDYNMHDPGISILEAVAYAITELAYRTGFPIRDILASVQPEPGTPTEPPYPDQTFYSARTILTVNPTTADDLRRLLIDVDTVQNAWVVCKSCACDAPYFSWCENDELVLSHDPSERSDPEAEVTTVQPQGLYDVLLELEADPTFGDLNDRKIVLRRTVTDDDDRRHVVTVEVRFPAFGLERRDERRKLAEDEQPFALAVAGPNRTKTGTTPIDDAELRRHWFDVFYVDFDVTLDDGTTIPIENAAMRVFGDTTVRNQTTVADLLQWLGDATEEGFVEPYRRKLAGTDQAIEAAKSALAAHRNLDEDFCHVDLIEIVEIGVCADVTVEASADIELVQAKIWFEIERYLDPPVEFWSLDELLDRGEPVEQIFNGPQLSNGFLTDEEVQESDLRTEVRVSDILDRLMDIDGVLSVDHLQLTAHDAEGQPVAGIADPTWTNGTPVFDPQRLSASWILFLEPDQRPRLHRGLSRFLFSSNGLPFLPRTDEAEDALVELRGRATRPKMGIADLDLPVPVGQSREMDAYYPVQHSFPLVYGIGPAGLPSTASTKRQAQAKQLKAYLMVYDQLLRNAYAQVAGSGKLFSLDRNADHTYFSALPADPKIEGYDEIVPALTAEQLGRLVESEAEFLERRNRFLDHLLARFGESFGDYAMLLTGLEGHAAARRELIEDKIGFLRAFPRVSHDRGKAIDRTFEPCDPDNAAGLQQKVNLLLGFRDLSFEYEAKKADNAPGFEHTLRLVEREHVIATFTPPPAVTDALEALLIHHGLDGSPDGWEVVGPPRRLLLVPDVADVDVTVDLTGADDEAGAGLRGELIAFERALLRHMILTDHYDRTNGDNWAIAITDGNGNELGTVADPEQNLFPSRSAADEFVAELATWSAHKRAIVVEHLLLRPKFPGDALYPACSDGECCTCGDEDPYSFRLTYVMPGWTAPFSTDVNMRGYANRTIQEQTPSHLLVKTCWVGNDGFVPDPCDPIVDALADALEDHVEDRDAACACAAELYGAYAEAFEDWFEENPSTRGPANILAETLDAMFAEDVEPADVPCIDAIDEAAELHNMLVDHFVGVAQRGYQFERFEEAWCAWATADAAIDWSEERLQDALVELLAARVTADVDHATLCTHAAAILAGFATEFRSWMRENVEAGHTVDELTPFDPPITLPPAGLPVAAGTALAIRTLLHGRYDRYREVSYRLHTLVHLLAELRNTYPSATLHDCDEGSDVNPVRLEHTTLGSMR